MLFSVEKSKKLSPPFSYEFIITVFLKFCVLFFQTKSKSILWTSFNNLLSRWIATVEYIRWEIPSALVINILPLNEVSLKSHWFSFLWVFSMIALTFNARLFCWSLVIVIPKYWTSFFIGISTRVGLEHSLTDMSSHLLIFRVRPERPSRIPE